jgi:hypothetical protein
VNNGAPRLNALQGGEGPEGGNCGARSTGLLEAAAVLIRIWIERVQPLAGTAATEGGAPLAFEGWLELLTVVSELVHATPRGEEDAGSDPPANAAMNSPAHIGCTERDQ